MKILSKLTTRHGHEIQMYLSKGDFIKCSFLGKTFPMYFGTSDIIEIEKIEEVDKTNSEIFKNIIDIDNLWQDIDGFTEVDCMPIYTDKGLITGLELNHKYKNYRFISRSEGKYYFNSDITLVNMIAYNEAK